MCVCLSGGNINICTIKGSDGGQGQKLQLQKDIYFCLREYITAHGVFSEILARGKDWAKVIFCKILKNR